MERIEIRLSKIKPLRIIIPIAIALPVITYAVYFTDKFADNQYIKYWIPLLDIWGIYVLYKPIMRLIENRPVITLTEDYLETNDDNGTKKYNWTEITNVTIGKDEKNVQDLLKINTGTTGTTNQINISPLDKSPGEIQGLINKYR
jgi:hypothetical protein